MAHIVLTFDNNRLASALYGQFDENLARIEQKLGVDVRSKGNQLSIRGEPTATEQARRARSIIFMQRCRRVMSLDHPMWMAHSAWQSLPMTS